MKKFSGTATKKPVVIDWFKWNNNFEDLIDWVEDLEQEKVNITKYFLKPNPQLQKELRVITLEGHFYDVPVGYIIIRGVEGEYYPCDSKIFNKTYQIIKGWE